MEIIDDSGRIQSTGDRGVTIMQNKFARHGDRNLRRIDTLGISKIPKTAKPSNHNIVGIGETTHKHVINGQALVYDLEKPQNYTVDGRQIMVDQFVEVLEPCSIQHEEHKPILIQTGKYAIVPEREIDILAQKIRKVMD